MSDMKMLWIKNWKPDVADLMDAQAAIDEFCEEFAVAPAAINSFAAIDPENGNYMVIIDEEVASRLLIERPNNFSENPKAPGFRTFPEPFPPGM